MLTSSLRPRVKWESNPTSLMPPGCYPGIARSMLLQHIKSFSHIGQPHASHPLLCCHFTAQALSVAMGKLKLNSQWESNPQVKGLYATQAFQSRIERDSLASTPLRGATVSDAVLGKTVLKGNLSCSGQHGSITP